MVNSEFEQNRPSDFSGAFWRVDGVGSERHTMISCPFSCMTLTLIRTAIEAIKHIFGFKLDFLIEYNRHIP